METTIPAARRLADIRADFPFLSAHPDRVYLDSAATAQRPEAVIEAESAFVRESYAAVHRGSSIATGTATVAFVPSNVAPRPSRVVISPAADCLAAACTM